jgi:thiamine-phosphate pyrophosphorylase
MSRAQSIRGLYAIADAAACDNDPVRGVAQILAGGCRLVQLRCKHWTMSEIEAAGREAAALCRDVDATFILNDHAVLVAAVGADGVHIGQGDSAPSVVRKIVGPGAIIGWTTDPNGLSEPAPDVVDYLALGPVWDSKRAGSHKSTQGLEALRSAIQRNQSTRPWVAIGGLNADRIAQVRAAGAHSWAVIGAIFDADDPVEATKRLMEA